MSIDHLALLPAYCAGRTALLAFLVDLLAPGRPVAVPRAALVAALFAALTLCVVALSVPDQSQGEYSFLLGCSITGGVVLAFTLALISLTIAVETLPLPLYPLVAFRRRDVASAQG